MRVSFIEAKSPEEYLFRKFPMPRLGSVLLSTILKQNGYEVKAFVENAADPDWSYIENSDVVCISTITSTALRAYQIGKRIMAKGIPVIMGGVHPSFLPEEALEYSDFVIRGEGEHALLELMKHIDGGGLPVTSIQGLSFKKKNGVIVHNPSRPLLETLDGLPEPDFSLVHNWDSSKTYPVSTSRGCPFNCSFCSVIQMFGRKYRFKSIDSALGEMRHAAAASKATKFIVDDNFTANKERTKEILNAMISEGIRMRWAAQVRTDVARDDELLRLMADSGCHTVHIGFESINPRTLEAYNKKQKKEDIVSCIKSVRDHGIHINGMFVFGADTDDIDTIQETVHFAVTNGIDTIQLAVLTPLPGTKFFDEMKINGRLLTTDWTKYNAQYVVFMPKQMTPRSLQVETAQAWEKFYSWKYILRHLSKFELSYAAIGLYCNYTMKKTRRSASRYLETLDEVVNTDRASLMQVSEQQFMANAKNN
jgi:radical SAM superfamily enzyme YgiQ (UPF0313 family)